MRCAGFVEGARRLFIGLLTGAAAAAAAGAMAQDVQQLYAQGVQALQAGRPVEAREAFARVIAQDPSFAGAWLDLAVATHALGDTVQAEEFLAIVERRFAPLPEAVSQGVAALRARIAASQPTASWRWRHALQVGMGRDSNANSGLSLRDINLTLPGGSILLPLDPGFRPRADSHFLTQFSTEGQHRLGQGELEVSASLRLRSNNQETAFDTSELQAGVAYTSAQPLLDGGLPFLPGPWRVGMQWQTSRLGEATVLQTTALSAHHVWTQRACSPQAGVQLEVRQFPVAGPLDSQVFWLDGQINCASALGYGADRLRLQVRLGNETAKKPSSEAMGRPGGNTRFQEWTLTHDWVWAGRNGRHRLEVLAQWIQGRDTEGYSPVLDDGARRLVRRTTAGLAYVMPLSLPGSEAGNWMAAWSLQAYRQGSNLGIFRIQGELLQVMLRRAW